MLLPAFLDALHAGEERLYLTTEASGFDEHERLSVCSSPLQCLLDDFPLRPRLAGRLVPAAFNLWLGRSSSGASSGLHHDWHDNLYCLLRGRKHFELYAPSETLSLYPCGELARIHENGRINYAAMPSAADGSDARDAERVARLDIVAAELALEAAEASAEARELGAAARLRAAEAEMERALAACLSAAGGEIDGRSDEERDGKEDAAPPHFSACRTREHALGDADRFPLFARAVCLAVELSAGDALFLPAGWWHEVFSRGAGGSHTHAALNYWFHPPDAPAFNQPYCSDLWERDWEHWRRDILPGISSARPAEQLVAGRQ
jgi:hypothetical protein